jgi:hypothetical protein
MTQERRENLLQAGDFGSYGSGTFFLGVRLRLPPV